MSLNCRVDDGHAWRILLRGIGPGIEQTSFPDLSLHWAYTKTKQLRHSVLNDLKIQRPQVL